MSESTQVVQPAPQITFPVTVERVFKSGKKKGEEKTYFALVTIANVQEALQGAVAYVVWKLQDKARNGQYPAGVKCRVNFRGEFTLSDEEQAAAMSDAELERRMEILLAQKQAREQARAAQEMANSKPYEEMSAAELDAATDPKPAKAATTKGRARR